MEQVTSRPRGLNQFADTLADRVKRAVKAIGVFTDVKAYRGEIVRYESEIQRTAGYENEPALKNNAGAREAAPS